MINPKWIIIMNDEELDEFNLSAMEATGVNWPHDKIKQFLRGNRIYYYHGKRDGFYNKKMVDFILDRISGGLWRV